MTLDEITAHLRQIGLPHMAEEVGTFSARLEAAEALAVAVRVVQQHGYSHPQDDFERGYNEAVAEIVRALTPPSPPAADAPSEHPAG